jgi:hypothetical protein
MLCHVRSILPRRELEMPYKGRPIPYFAPVEKCGSPLCWDDSGGMRDSSGALSLPTRGPFQMPPIGSIVSPRGATRPRVPTQEES